jgi:hypothetical protein
MNPMTTTMVGLCSHSLVVAKARPEKKSAAEAAGSTKNNRNSRNSTRSENVWEVRRQKFEKVMIVVGQKVEAGLWVAAAILVIYYTNFVRVMFTHKGVNK